MDGNSRRSKAKRKTIKECPNPLFLKWLERWRDEAKAKDSKLQYVYNKAIGSLKKYPLPLESGKESTILDGIGPGIAKRLDEELEKHNRDLQNDVVLDLADDDITEVDFPDLRVPPPPNMVATINGTPKSCGEPKPKKKRKSSPREYIPVYRSGPYAMMIALLKASEGIGYKGYLTKAELQQQAQPYTETSFTVPEPDSYYTAWSSMSTLTKKGLVMKSGNPVRFSLTNAGYDLADKLTTATATHTSTISSPSQTLPQLPTESFSPPSTPRTSAVPKPRTPATPRARGVSKPHTPTASPQTIILACNDLPASESISQSPRYGNPSKDFLASYRYKTSGTEVPQCQLGSLKFWYIGSDGECVPNQDKAAVIIDDEITFGYLVKCRKSELDKAKVKYKLDTSRHGQDGHVFVYVDSDAITRSSEATESNVATQKKSTAKPHTISNVSDDDDSDDEMLMRPLFERLGGGKSDSEKMTKPGHTFERASATTSFEITDISSEIITITECSQPKVLASSKSTSSRSNITTPTLSTTRESMPAQVKQLSKETQPSQAGRPAQTKPGTKVKQPTRTTQPVEAKQTTEAKLATIKAKEPSAVSTSRLITTESISPPIRESDAPNKVDKVIVPEYELKAGSFEIILCVDFIETTGGSKTIRKEEMVKELRMNGVCFHVRKLNVGDFLWVAREKMLPVPGQLVLPERRELVMDYIVERKRMDDLCSSIKDGRFKEQKFRLLNSGLKHPVYLVEDFGSMSFMSMPAQTLEQAIINTQNVLLKLRHLDLSLAIHKAYQEVLKKVGEEFFVKRTRDIKESAAYLTLMTRYLQNAYENQTLKAIKKDDMEYVKVEENQVNTFLMTFQELNDISIKNRVVTVGELFGKQLLQIPGVAAEKVVGILEHYPTLRDLLEAYEEKTTEKEKENLLSDIKFGKTQRKIGPSVSKTVHQLYCTKGALS